LARLPPSLYPQLTTIGEVFHPDSTVTSFFVGGKKGWDNIDTALTTVFDFLCSSQSATFSCAARRRAASQTSSAKIRFILTRNFSSRFSQTTIFRASQVPKAPRRKTQLAFGLF